MPNIRRSAGNGRLGRAVLKGELVFLTGQVGEPGQSVKEQTASALAAVERLLEQAGTSKSAILNASVLLADIADLSLMNEA